LEKTETKNHRKESLISLDGAVRSTPDIYDRVVSNFFRQSLNILFLYNLADQVVHTDGNGLEGFYWTAHGNNF
jgi:hypothetical protein